MSLADLLSAPANAIQRYLIIQGYHNAECPCNVCDALHSLALAIRQLEIARTEILSGENPSEEKRAEAASRQVADGESPLAVAVAVSPGAARYNLFADGNRLMTDWAHEILKFAEAYGYQISFLPKK